VKIGTRATTALLCLVGLSMLAAGCRRHRDDGTVGCTPGVVYVVACDNEGVGRCSGDPKLRVCDGAVSVPGCWSAEGQLDEDDDGGDGLCSRATATCPPSGSFTVVTTDFGSSYGSPEDRYGCDWDVQPVGGGGDLPLPPDAGP